jgi:argininosuccinate lyase
MAEYLVTKGMTFRKAHETVGQIVLFAIEKKKSLKDLTLKDLKGFNRQITKDVFEWLDPESAIARRNLHGATGYEAVKQSIKRAKREVGR